MARLLDTSFSGRVNYALRASYYSFKCVALVRKNNFKPRFPLYSGRADVSRQVNLIKESLPKVKEVRPLLRSWGGVCTNRKEANRFFMGLSESHAVGLFLMMGNILRSQLLNIIDVKSTAYILSYLNNKGLLNLLGGIKLSRKEAADKVLGAINYIETNMGAHKMGGEIRTSLPESWDTEIKFFFS